MEEIIVETTNYVVRGIPFYVIDNFWKHGEAFIKRALDHANGEMTFEDVKEACKNRDMQLWFICDKDSVVATISTEIINYPQLRVCRIVTLAGKDFEKWIGEADQVISQWAGEQGCHGLEAFIRSGFYKKLNSRGFKKKYEVVYRDI